MDHACAASADKGWRIYFLGAAPGVAELAAERMRLRHPGCNIVGARHGYFPPESDAVVAAEVAEAKPDLLFVAMGIPRQEKFIRATESIIGAKVAMGVGGTFDVFSGKVRRAPRLLQKMRLEWAWRLAQNPKKIGKVALLPRFGRARPTGAGLTIYTKTGDGGETGLLGGDRVAKNSLRIEAIRRRRRAERDPRGRPRPRGRS